MPEPPTCPQCGAPLPADAPDGHCLRCLLGLGLARGSGANDGVPAPAENDSYPGYRIMEKIGEGGCGVVYRAEQTEPVRREVAIKVVKLGMDTRSVIARFEAERQALALMNHPNIARVFDAGSTGRGHPFFVMELVAGESLTRYCDRHQLSVAHRLGLFLQVCEGVRHAHLKGIIHRDLKPSNILVAEVDGKPVPKVIDFGVAKAMDHQRLGAQTIYTAFDQFVGTPAYMSPEQAGLTGEGIDQRSDIYALGVLLYELLTGRPPFEPERLRRAAVDEICRIIREEEPSLPSARLSALDLAELTSTAHRRLLPGRRLVSQVRGDLDGIVMKALEKSPDRRYDNTHEFAADIARHLRHEPVSARPPGTLRRVWKFARRNKVGVGAAALVFCALAGGLAVSSWALLQERRARERLERRAYLSDMNTATRMAALRVGGLGGAAGLLETWRRQRPDLRGWEWYYLHGLCHHELLTIRADPTELWSVSWSPDGRQLATGGTEATVKVWDAATGAALATLTGHTDTVRVVAWSPDGRWLASASLDNTIRLWDVAKGTGTVLGGHDTAASTLAWRPDGRHLASGSADGSVRIWDPAAATAVRTVTTEARVRVICWNGDGTRLFAFGTNGLARAWDADTGEPRLGFGLETGGEILAAGCSPDGGELATGGMENAVSFRDPATGANRVSLWDNQNAVLAIAWAADGTRLATATRGDGRLVIRDTRAGGRVIRDFRGHLGSVRSVAWRPDGARLASASADGTVRVWDTVGPNPSVRSLHQPDQAKALAWSPDGTKLASACRRMEAWIWDFDQGGTPIALDGGFRLWTHGVAWNPDGKRLASAATDGLRVWDTSTRTVLWRDSTSAENPRSVAWRPDGRELVAVCGDQLLVLWDGESGKVLNSRPLPAERAVAVAWSPDGGTIATGAGNRIRLWDAKLNPIGILSGHREAINRLAWSPDGRRLASAGGDTRAKIWDVRNRRATHDLLGHGAPVHGLAWSPDGTRLATAGWDMSLRIWDAETGDEVCAFDKPAGIIQMIDSVAWSPDGRRIAVSDIEGNIGVLDATPGWRADSGPGEAVPSPRGGRSAAETIRSLRLYCDTVEPRSADDPDALRRLAWIRATAPYAEVRDGRKAVTLAERANVLAGGRNAGVLAILAAAHAEAGDFTKAVKFQQQAIALLQGSASQAEYAAALRLYQSGRPCRDDSW